MEARFIDHKPELSYLCAGGMVEGDASRIEGALIGRYIAEEPSRCQDRTQGARTVTSPALDHQDCIFVYGCTQDEQTLIGIRFVMFA